MKTTIIGMGLIGGSFAMSLRDNLLSDHITAVDTSARNRETAVAMGLADKAEELEKAIADADLIVLSAPVDAIPSLAVKVLNRIGDRQVVMDMGSVKSELADMVSQHPKRGRLVATHPMWGTEYSGPESAVKGAFKGRNVVICDSQLSDPDARQLVEKIYTAIGMPILYMTSDEQDLHSAYISHISHITAYALALTVLEKEREDNHIFDLASSGFESTVRLAKSAPSMWVPIFMENKYNVLDVLREHIHQLQIFRKMLEQDDEKGLTKAIEKANAIRKIIK